MNENHHYFNVILDESIIDKMFQQINARLDQHDKEIQELKLLIQANNDNFSKFLSAKDEIEEKLNNNDKKIKEIDSKYDEKFIEADKNLDQRIVNLNVANGNQASQRIDDIEAAISKFSYENSNLLERISALEDEVDINAKKQLLTHESVQSIANGICLFNNTSPKLDSTLPDSLKNAISTVQEQIFALQHSIVNENHASPSIISPLSSPRNSTLNNIIQEKSGNTFSNIAVKERSISGTPSLNRIGFKASISNRISDKDNQNKNETNDQIYFIDPNLATIRPKLGYNVKWTDPIKLPTINQFLKVSDIASYIYDLIPYLQAVLSALHDQVLNNSSVSENKISNNTVKTDNDASIAKIKKVITELSGRMDELKDAVENTASREEINSVVEDLIKSMNFESQTAIGRVKCIACGREIPMVAGALTEEEAERILGMPPNSIAYSSNGETDLSFSGTHGFNSSIIETPRSVRRKTPRSVKLPIKGSNK